jgi:hypothetical protein
MPVNSTHPDYDFGLPGWLRARCGSLLSLPSPPGEGEGKIPAGLLPRWRSVLADGHHHLPWGTIRSALRVFSLARRSRRRLRNDSCGGCVFAGHDHYSAGCGKQSGERLRIYFFSYREIYRTASAKAADQSSKGLTGEFGGRREVPAHRVVIHRLRTKRVVA